MSETLEQIVRRVAIARGVLLFDGRSQDLIELVKEVVAELTKGQEPVAYYCGRNQFGSPQFRIGVLPITEGPLFAAPPICPTCTQMIDEAARQGRIVDDRMPDGWQLVPKTLTKEMQEDGYFTNPSANQTLWDQMLDAAPEYKKP